MKYYEVPYGVMGYIPGEGYILFATVGEYYEQYDECE